MFVYIESGQKFYVRRKSLAKCEHHQATNHMGSSLGSIFHSIVSYENILNKRIVSVAINVGLGQFSIKTISKLAFAICPNSIGLDINNNREIQIKHVS